MLLKKGEIITLMFTDSDSDMCESNFIVLKSFDLQGEYHKLINDYKDKYSPTDEFNEYEGDVLVYLLIDRGLIKPHDFPRFFIESFILSEVESKRVSGISVAGGTITYEGENGDV